MSSNFSNTEIFESAKDILIEDLSNNIIQNNISISDFNSNFVKNLLETGQSLVSLSKFNMAIYDDQKNIFTKEKYSFPSILNIGTLERWSTTPSKFLEGKKFHTQIPFLLPIENNPLIFMQNPKKKDLINDIIESISLKMIASLPNALSRNIIIDKTGSGQSFPNLIKLNDKFNNGIIISDDHEIEDELLTLKHSISTITSSITSNGFKSIEDYNNNTDEVPQPYRILNIANFPIGFSKRAAEALLSILESGSKVGIYTVMSISVNLKFGLNQSVAGIPLTEILKHAYVFEFVDRSHEYIRNNLLEYNCNIVQTPSSNDTKIKELLNSSFKIKFENIKNSEKENLIFDLNERIQDINIKPVIDIRKTIPDVFWDKESGPGVAAPFAKNGIEDVYLCLGVNQFGEDEGTHHALIGGSTGSGKTVLLHSMILHLSMKYSPSQLKFWLLDYKEGTEFATYKNFPHVDILSMQSEVEFGQEVLENAAKIMTERGILFKKVGVSNLKNYNKYAKENNLEELPRIIIIADEFQALFPKNPKITARSNAAINNILRLGRSFGINIMLATQTLKGIDMDPQLMSNIPLRIGLKMDKKDIAKLFDENNHAVSSLSDPGEGIYNKQFGISTANIHFQGYLALNEQVDQITNQLIEKMNEFYTEDEINKMNDAKFIYSGDSQSIYHDNENRRANEFYLGEYAGLNKNHTSFIFEDSFGENMIILGTDESKSVSLFYYTYLQLSKNSKVYLSSFNKKINNHFPKDEKIYTNVDFHEIVKELKEELENRKNDNTFKVRDENHIFLMSYFLDNSIDFSNSSSQTYKDLIEIISNGPEFGVHIIFYITTYSSLSKLGLGRDIEKFKKRISLTPSEIRIFSDDGILIPSSPFISFAHSGESGKQVVKFKPYILPEYLKKEDF